MMCSVSRGDGDGGIVALIEENNSYMNELSSFREVERKQYGNAASC